ncbi:MAG: hypothetical protein WA948_01455 [Pontixanthobacter sp.]
MTAERTSPPRTVQRARHIAVGIAGVAVLVLLAAWIDGGEEPVRLIEQPIDLGSSTNEEGGS